MLGASTMLTRAFLHLFPMVCLMLPAATGQEFAGARVCASCHPSQAASQAKTGHARSLFPGESHPLRERFGGLKGDWAFGAGEQAVTFVSRIDDEFYLEHGLSYYKASDKAGMTPGHRGPQGERYRIFDPGAAILKCFQCHSTGPLRLGDGFRIEPAEPGVQCESCHGPGSEHVRSPAARLRNPGKMTGAEMNEACGACHRQPPKNAFETDWGDPWNVRHQPVYLAQSACFLKGKVTCGSCHVAHESAVKRDACSACHAGVKHRAALAGKSCVNCHMPVVSPNAELRFANHWIGIYAPGAPLQPVARR
jgi:Cytochrome c554 and c-prime